MQQSKEDLVARIGEPTEENVQAEGGEPGKPRSVLRWECGCAAAKSFDDRLWEWDECDRHKQERPVV